MLSALFALGSRIIDAITKHVQNKDERERLVLEIQKQIQETASQLEYELLKQRGNIIVSEATGHSWLQRNWRPITMLVFVFIITNNYVLVPYAKAVFNIDLPILNLPDQVWNLLSYGLMGYIGARSVEKITGMVTTARMVKQKILELSDIKDDKRVPKVRDITLSIEDE
jgi:hypothetical protein